MTDTAHTVGPEEAGDTLAAVVRRRNGVSWRLARSMCTSGRVRLDGETVLDPAVRVVAGQRLELGPKGRTAVVESIPIHHVDREIVVVEKEAGLLSVPFEDETETAQHRVQAALRRRFGATPPVRVVQRLDRETSGVMVFARTRRAERELQRQFRAHTVERRYVALALGEVENKTHQTPLVPDRGDGLRGSWPGHARSRDVQRSLPSNARWAITHVECLARVEFDAARWCGPGGGCVSLVACRLETGRQHQIRIHLAEDGHPLLGEKVYVREYAGGLPAGGPLSSPRTMLHAQTLGLEHPADGKMLRFESPLPEDFLAWLEHLGFDATRAS